MHDAAKPTSASVRPGSTHRPRSGSCYDHPMPALERLTEYSTLAIVVLAAAHLFALLVLAAWARRDRRRIAATLFEFTRGLKHQSVLASGRADDQIDAFLADIGETLQTPPGSSDRSELRTRLSILDERRAAVQSGSFATCYNVARTMIEAYPLLGVLGTILAIGGAVQNEATVQTIVARFGDAIWSTGAGLVAAVVLMFVNGLLEPGFLRLSESRALTRDAIARAKRELHLDGAAGAATVGAGS